MRVLSGIQPSGPLHIGNYCGAIRQYVALQQGNDAYYFVADYHALTSVRDAVQLRGYVNDVLIDLLSLGLDPQTATLFVQSDVPETVELAWLLTSVTPMGWLEKCVSYKDKVQQGLPADHGLFAYPVLQAADILLSNATWCPWDRIRSSTWRSPATSPSGSTTFTATGARSSGCRSLISLTP